MSVPILPLTQKAEMLLTSVGFTTDVIQRRLRELVGRSGTILRFSDGLAVNGFPLVTRLTQRVGSTLDDLDSDSGLRGILGNSITIRSIRIGALSRNEASQTLIHADLVLAPGGNTYQLAYGLLKHGELIRQHVGQGLPYVGVSAGTIVAGKTILSAALPPPDPRPDIVSSMFHTGLDLVSADIVTHAPGFTGSFHFSGNVGEQIIERLTALFLSTSLSPVEAIAAFERQRAKAGIPVSVLNLGQALSISHGKVELI